MRTLEILSALTESYKRKGRPGSPITVSFDIVGEGEMWHLAVPPDGHIRLGSGDHPKSEFTIVVAAETLSQLASGNLSPLTAAGRESLRRPAPLGFRLPPGVEFSQAIYHRVVQFAQRFFNPLPNERIRIGENVSRVVHGGHVVALYADEGFRSAWYLLKPGQRLNEPGDTNPFPQAFVVLSGSGTARLNGQQVTLEADNAYYIPPGTEHTVEPLASSSLTLIWMAWGAGA